MPVETEGRHVFGAPVTTDDGDLALRNAATGTVHLVAKHGADIEENELDDRPSLPYDWTACHKGEDMPVVMGLYRISDVAQDTVHDDEDEWNICAACQKKRLSNGHA